MQVTVYEADNGACPYLPDRSWITHSFHTETMPESLYEAMLGDGWRRSGTTFYQNHCPGCRCCTAVRIPVHEFAPSRSQRRVLRRNTDVAVRITEPSANPETINLYRRYLAARHGRSLPDVIGAEEHGEATATEELRSFLVDTPLATRAMEYRTENRLLGVGWIDVLSHGLSSVYFAFDPDESRRSLGIFSIMKEMDLARDLAKQWLYLGFYVPGSPKMAYKGAFRPAQFAVAGGWTRDPGTIPC